jgi:uncharacterized delta-60 repeat protein
MKKMITQCLVALCLFGTFATNAQKKLVSDATFAKNGTYTTPSDSADYYFTQIFPLPNGGTLTTGILETDTVSFISILKLDTQGKPDPTFGKKGIALIETTLLPYESVYKVVENADKSILILLGQGNSLIEADGSMVLKLNANGKLDDTFADGAGFAGLAPITDEAPGAIGDMVALPNGGFLTLSIYLNATDNIISQFVRYKANGAIDSSYAKQGQAVILNKANQAFIKINPVGKNFILSGIDINLSNGLFRRLIAKADIQGKLDTKFGTNIIANKNSPDDEFIPLDVKVAADSSLICVTSVKDTLGTSFYEVTKVKANGKVDNLFGTNGTLKLEPAFGVKDFPLKTIELLNDGSILTIFPANEESSEVNANLYDTKGVLDSKFGDNGDFIFSVGKLAGVVFGSSLQADGKILITGASLASADGHTSGFVSRLSLSANVANTDASLVDAKLSIFPNPIQQQATVTYQVQDATNTTLELIDAQGKIIQQLTSKNTKSQGKQTENVDFSNSLPTGNYVLRLKIGDKQQTIKVVKM